MQRRQCNALDQIEIIDQAPEQALSQWSRKGRQRAGRKSSNWEMAEFNRSRVVAIRPPYSAGNVRGILASNNRPRATICRAEAAR